MPQHEPLFEILSQNFVCVCMCTCSVGVKTIGRKRTNNSSRKSSFQIDCIFKEAAKAHCLQECARNLIVRTEVPLCFISLGHVQHLHKFMFHLKTALFYYCASVFNVELILLHFVCFFIFFSFTIPPLKSIYVPHALAFKRSYSSKVVSPFPLVGHCCIACPYINPLNP